MTRYLLDTNIISNLVKPVPSVSLMEWMGTRNDEELFIASLTVAEIKRGIFEMPRGKKKHRPPRCVVFGTGRAAGSLRRQDPLVR